MEISENAAPKFILEQRDAIEVYASQKGFVCLKQSSYQDEDAIIAIHPNDVPQLIKFLQNVQQDALEIRDYIAAEAGTSSSST